MRASTSPLGVLSALVVLLSTSVLAQTITRYCSPESATVCFAEATWPGGTRPIFRIAIPDNVQSAPFETILQIVAPISLTWVGFAWGGGMVNNPITMAWMNGNTAVVSSRWATARTVPGMYNQATVKALMSSRNATHWTAEILCTGCSRWTGGEVSPVNNNQFAWGSGRAAVAQPSNPQSSFPKHTDVRMYGAMLQNGRVPSAAFNSYKARVPVPMI